MKQEKSIVGGLAWKFSERLVSQGVSFAVSLVLARLLSPDDYGLIALVLVFINLAGVFITSGFATALIQKKDADDTDFSTIFYCSLLCSFAIYLLIFLIAPLVAAFYEQPMLREILWVFGLQVPLGVFNSIQTAYISRHMLFKKVFFSTLISAVISGGVGICMAWSGLGVWALVGQSLSMTLCNTLVMLVIVPWRPKRLFSAAAAKQMLKYGGGVLVADLSGTFFNELRSLIVGRVYTGADLAYYNKGQQLPGLITNNLSGTLIAVMFPALANYSDDLQQVRDLARRSMRVLAFVLVPCLFGMAAVMEPLVLLLYGEKWTQVIPYGQILSVGMAVGVFGIIPLQVLKAIGRSDVTMKLEIWKKPVYLALLVMGVCINVYAIAVTMLIYEFYGVLVNMAQMKKHIDYKLRSQLVDLLPAFALGTVMAAVVLLIPSLGSLVLTLAVKVLTGITVYLGGALLLKMEELVLLKEKIGNLLGKKKVS